MYSSVLVLLVCQLCKCHCEDSHILIMKRLACTLLITGHVQLTPFCSLDACEAGDKTNLVHKFNNVHLVKL